MKEPLDDKNCEGFAVPLDPYSFAAMCEAAIGLNAMWSRGNAQALLGLAKIGRDTVIAQAALSHGAATQSGETPRWRVKDDEGDDLIAVWKRRSRGSDEYAAAEIIEELEGELATLRQNYEYQKQLAESLGGVSAAARSSIATRAQIDAWHDEAMATGSKTAINRLHDVAARALHDLSLAPSATRRTTYAERVALPLGLHQKTADLVMRFASALAEKLRKAEEKYGYDDGWSGSAWEEECRERLHEHLAKGDPRDVANYCAFMWHHGWSTSGAWKEVEGYEGVLRHCDARDAVKMEMDHGVFSGVFCYHGGKFYAYKLPSMVTPDGRGDAHG